MAIILINNRSLKQSHLCKPDAAILACPIYKSITRKFENVKAYLQVKTGNSGSALTFETIGQPKYACHIRFQYISITSQRNKQATNTSTVITFCIVNLPTSRMYSSIPALESRWLHSLPTYFFTSSEPLNTRCLMFACTAASIAFRPYKY